MTNHPNRGRRDAASNPLPADIIAARETAGLSQSDAAALIYSGLRTWQHWESGDRRMHPGLWELWQIKLQSAPKKPVSILQQTRAVEQSKEEK